MSDAAPRDSPVRNRLDRLPVALRWVIFAFGVVAGGAGLVATVLPLFNATMSDGWVALLFATMLFLSTATIWLLASQFNRLFTRLADEASALRTQVADSVAQARSVDFTLAVARRLNDEIATVNHPDLTTHEVLAFIQRACDGLRDAYKHAVGLDTRVCVKQVGAGLDEPPYVTDVYRTNQVVDRANTPHHPIEGNTDFRQLVRREKSVWFTGRRSHYPDYVTTSIDPKYESVIVWPIMPRVSPEAGTANVPHTIRAFLCLDSEVTDAFSETRDVAVGWMLADALARAYENARD